MTDKLEHSFGPGADQAREELASRVAAIIRNADHRAARLMLSGVPEFDAYRQAWEDGDPAEAERALIYARLRCEAPGPKRPCRACGLRIVGRASNAVYCYSCAQERSRSRSRHAMRRHRSRS